MTASRPCVPDDVLALFALLAVVLPVDALATVFLVIIIAYLPIPFGRRLEACEASRWVASLAATVVVAVGVGVALTPLIAILLLRLSDILEPAVLLPDVVTIEFLGMVETVTLDDVVAVDLGLLRSVSRIVATAASVVLIKLTLLGFLVFALPFSGDVVGWTLSALVPADYWGVTTVFDERARETLFVIYVLQAVTAVGTLAIGLVVFWVPGYDYVVTLATVAAVLQFIPIVGPSILLVTMAAYHAAVGDVVAAVLVVTLPAEPVDLLGVELRVDDVGGDDDERDESADDSANPSQP